jgi:hypothetical protein
MSDGEAGFAPAADREAWLRNLRRVDEEQEDALAGDFDARWGEIEPIHQAFVERFLSMGGLLYLTVELARDDRVRAANQAARRRGLPVVDGEVIWEGPDGYYHHYPSMPQVRAWLADAGFAIQEETEGPWHDDGYAYHHLLARMAALPG